MERSTAEVAARLTIELATALGWPARLVTASKDGYKWNHALSELWSNQFSKWVLFDTDYNVFFESNGIPLSAYEICHRGEELRDEKKLAVRRFAPLKPSMKDNDLLRLFRYIHIDMRNDWFTRPLRAGSPAGGDLATWWTSRETLGPLLTQKIRVDDQARFDWPINWVDIHTNAVKIVAPNQAFLTLGLKAYAPYFKAFAVRQDGNDWQFGTEGSFTIQMTHGEHLIEARIVTLKGEVGPTSFIFYRWQNRNS